MTRMASPVPYAAPDPYTQLTSTKGPHNVDIVVDRRDVTDPLLGVVFHRIVSMQVWKEALTLGCNARLL